MTVSFDVDNYGAIGDGQHDDTAAIQKAIDAASAAGGGEVHLARGTYIVSGDGKTDDGALIIKSNVQLVGDGEGATVIKLADGYAHNLNGIVHSQAGVDTINVGARELTIDGNQANTSGTVAGWVQGSSGSSTVKNSSLQLNAVEFKNNSGDGLHILGQVSGVVVANSSAHDNGGDGFNALFNIDSSHGDSASFTGDSAFNNGLDGFNVQIVKGDSVQFVASAAHDNGRDGLSYSEFAPGTGRPLNSSGNILVSGGVYSDNVRYGIHIANTDAVGSHINGAQIEGNGAEGVIEERANLVALTGNTIADNAHTQGQSEIRLRNASNTDINANVIYGGEHSAYAIFGTVNDTNDLSGNPISHVQKTSLHVGGGDFGARILFGLPVDHQVLNGAITASQITGGYANSVIVGGAGDDTISGGLGSDTVLGGGGADVFSGGADADTFLFLTTNDSYRTATTSHSDVITDFDASHDIIDAALLGFSGLGDGHHGTLQATYNTTQDRTYVRSLDADSAGRYFQIAISGDQTASLSAANFASVATSGASDAAVNQTFLGTAHNDSLIGGAGNDHLYGGAGADTLTSGAGEDTFYYTQLSDSHFNTVTHKGAVDLISDYGVGASDAIDVSALGITGIGKGEHELRASYANHITTYASNDIAANGDRFQISFAGQIPDVQFIFANDADIYGTAGADHLPPSLALHERQGLAGNDTLSGGGDTLVDYGSQLLDGGAGDDKIYGSLSNDRIVGGTGADRLWGFSGADTFVYNTVDDSYRSASEAFSDQIRDFSPSQDKIDVSALGLTGIGDGRDHTLQVSYSATSDRTYLKSFESDASGHRFQLILDGNFQTALTTEQIVFAQPKAQVAATAHDATPEVPMTLLGATEHPHEALG